MKIELRVKMKFERLKIDIKIKKGKKSKRKIEKYRIDKKNEQKYTENQMRKQISIK